MGSEEFNCDTNGVGTITLEHAASLTFAAGVTFSHHWEDNAVDTLTVNCVEPQGDITGKWNVKSLAASLSFRAHTRLPNPARA